MHKDITWITENRIEEPALSRSSNQKRNRNWVSKFVAMNLSLFLHNQMRKKKMFEKVMFAYVHRLTFVHTYLFWI